MTKSIVALLHSGQTKNTFNHIIREVVPDSKVTVVKSTNALVNECLNNLRKVGTVFIEHGFPMPDIINCLTELRAGRDNRPDKIILLIGEASAKENILSQHLSLGFSGILNMPFSEASLYEVLKVSEELSLNGSFARLKVVTGLQIKSMLEQKGERFASGSILAAVRNACQIFEEENPGKTVEEIAQEYTLMEPKDRLGKSVKDLYQGASERVRKLVEAREKKVNQEEDEPINEQLNFSEEKGDNS